MDGRSSSMQVPSLRRPGRFKDGSFLVVAALIALVAMVLRLYRLGRQELWIDEAYSFLLATRPEWFGPATFANNTPPLYHFLLRVWIGFAGDSEASLRLPSAIGGTLFVVGVIWVGRRVLTPAVGLWSGGLAALSPFHIYYSQEARVYTLLALALLVTYAMMARAAVENTRRAWALAAAAAVIALYCHPIAAFGIATTPLLVWAVAKDQAREPPWRRCLTAIGTAILIYLPWVLASSRLGHHGMENPFSRYLGQDWEALPPSMAIPYSLEALMFGGQEDLPSTLVKQRLAIPPEVTIPGMVLLLILGLVLAMPSSGVSGETRALWRRRLWLWVALLFPLACLWLISFLFSPIYLVGRYDITALPAFILLAGLTLSTLFSLHGVRRSLAVMLMAGIMVLSAVRLSFYFGLPISQAAAMQSAPAKRMADILDSSVANGDIVVFSGGRWYPVLYYLRRHGYQWHDGMCEQKSADRRFSCRLLPTQVERTLSFAVDPEEMFTGLEDDFTQIVRPSKDATLWVGFEALVPNRLETWFVSHLEQEGFRMNTNAAATGGMDTFRRP